MRHAAMWLGIVLCGVSSLVAQKPALPPNSSSNQGASGNSGGNAQQPAAAMISETRMPAFISGRILMEDGTPPPASIGIQRICSGMPRTVAWSNAKGQFSFQWGDTTGIIPDASEPMQIFGRSSSDGSGGGGNAPSMAGCELSASAAGFRSGRIDLSDRRVSDNPDIGAIILHRMAEVEGTSVSATALSAPKDARKAWEKGAQFLRASGQPRLGAAEKEFLRAVEIYPAYANAWSDLGRVRLQEGKTGAAREAFQRALAADAKLVEPYVQLGEQAAREQNWREAGLNLDRALQLDPVDYPRLWFEDAVANYNLRNFARAEKNARAALQLRRIDPRANQLLGLILMTRHDYAGAKEALRSYVQMLPNAQDLDHVKAQLLEIDTRLAEPVR
jgi:tetratricopeptide (TPR) repeat protein